MIPGPTHVVACPGCRGLHQQLTFLSGNAYGARRWTDGKIDAPMYPVTPRFIVCVHCRKGFFLEDAKVVGNIPFGSESSLTPPEWQNAPRILWPHIGDYIKMIEGKDGEKDAERVRYLRIHLWWALNDALSGRGTPSFKAERIDNPLSGDMRKEYGNLFVKNLESLIGMLSSSSPDTTLKAEALRELGRFEEALSLLPESYALEIHDMIRELARKKNSRVAELSVGS